MTIWGIDVSHNQSGLDPKKVKQEGFSFMYGKVTEGQGFRDPNFAEFRDAAKAAGMLFAAYHFLRSDSSAAEQAANTAAAIGDKSIPVIIDCEINRGSRPNLQNARDYAAALGHLGVRASAIYLPHFWWQSLGSPSLAGWKLVQALYPNNRHDFASRIYPGDNDSAWNSMGGVVPSILQFGDQVKLSSYTANVVDADAFRGTLDQLKALEIFKDWSGSVPVPKPPTPAPVKIGGEMLLLKYQGLDAVWLVNTNVRFWVDSPDKLKVWAKILGKTVQEIPVEPDILALIPVVGPTPPEVKK